MLIRMIKQSSEVQWFPHVSSKLFYTVISTGFKETHSAAWPVWHRADILNIPSFCSFHSLSLYHFLSLWLFLHISLMLAFASPSPPCLSPSFLCLSPSFSLFVSVSGAITFSLPLSLHRGTSPCL